MTTTGTRMGVRQIAAKVAAGEKLVAVTAYDALMGRMADEAQIDIVLVGDSVGMTMLGYPNTLRVTLDDMLRHTAAVARGVRRAMVVADMPFLTYTTPEEAVRNAGRFLREAGADAVKLEGGRCMAQTIARLTGFGIPVMGHIGLLPQAVLREGGYRVHGKSEAEAADLVADALAVRDAGAFSVVLEGLPAALGARITREVGIPTIGIGAGGGCSGQIQVIHDILGLFEDFIPKHTKRYAELAGEVRRALAAYRDDVANGTFPGKDQSA